MSGSVIINILGIISFCSVVCNFSYGQITIEKKFNLELAEKDSIKSLKLEKSLNAFLTEAKNGSISN